MCAFWHMDRMLNCTQLVISSQVIRTEIFYTDLRIMYVRMYVCGVVIWSLHFLSRHGEWWAGPGTAPPSDRPATRRQQGYSGLSHPPPTNVSGSILIMKWSMHVFVCCWQLPVYRWLGWHMMYVHTYVHVCHCYMSPLICTFDSY